MYRHHSKLKIKIWQYLALQCLCISNPKQKVVIEMEFRFHKEDYSDISSSFQANDMVVPHVAFEWVTYAPRWAGFGFRSQPRDGLRFSMIVFSLSRQMPG
jgi:hypothetical protein